jgi:hypothetical protein
MLFPYDLYKDVLSFGENMFIRTLLRFVGRFQSKLYYFIYNKIYYVNSYFDYSPGLKWNAHF